MKKVLHDSLIAGALPWIALIVSPITMYLGNQDQYGSVTPLLVTFIGAFAIGTALLLLPVWTARTRTPLYRVLGGTLVGLALGAWIQGQLLVWDLGPLDGRGLAWEKFERHAWLEIVVWLVVVALTIALFVRQSRIAKSLAQAVWILGAISLGTGILSHGISRPAKTATATTEYPSVEQALSFHPKNNTLVIVLDTFQSDAFLEILEKYPEEADFLDGFTYYPDTVGGYPTTRHSIPLILTGKFYKNDFPYDNANRERFERTTLLSYYADKGYGVVGDVDRPLFVSFESDVVFPPQLRNKRFYGASGGGIRALDIGLFRASPIILKKSIYDESRWFLSKLASNDFEPPALHGNDWRFVQRFVADANASSTRIGELKFIHLTAAHSPLSVDENFRYVPGLANTRGNYVNQARGALSLARRMLEKLKNLEIYTNAEILIVADHGTHNEVPIDLRVGEQGLTVPLAHIGGARPLLLHKAKGAEGKIQTSDQPMHLSYAPCILGDTMAFDCDAFTAAESGEMVPRPHYRYEWLHDFWFKDYSPPMTLYEVRGDARKGASWSNSEMVFEDGAVHKLGRSYRMGDLIDFGQTGTAGKYLLSGWSGQEVAHRWTEGRWAKLGLDMPENSSRSLRMELEAYGFSLDGAQPQLVTVFVNDVAIADWKILARRKFIATIPVELAMAGRMTIAFHISEPRSPYEIDGRADHRQLGFAAFGLTLIPSKN